MWQNLAVEIPWRKTIGQVGVEQVAHVASSRDMGTVLIFVINYYLFS